MTFEPIILEEDGARIGLGFEGEGRWGDFKPQIDADVPVLRLRVFSKRPLSATEWNTHATDADGWGECIEGSWRTNLDARAPREALMNAANEMLKIVRSVAHLGMNVSASAQVAASVGLDPGPFVPGDPDTMTREELIAERERLLEQLEDLKDIVQDIAWQEAHYTVSGGVPAIFASAGHIKDAFRALRWPNPKPLDEAERHVRTCNHPGCVKEGRIGTPTPDGYKRLCNEHYDELKANDEKVDVD